MKIEWEKLLLSIAIPLGVGAFSGQLIQNGVQEYAFIEKPVLSPPAIIFPIVWTILYVLMGISFYLIRETDSTQNTKAVLLYAVQLLLNFIWPLIFFEAKNYLLAFIVLLILWFVVLFMIIVFYDIRPLSAYLQIPYLLWLTFAAYLNISVYLLNHST